MYPVLQLPSHLSPNWETNWVSRPPGNSELRLNVRQGNQGHSQGMCSENHLALPHGVWASLQGTQQFLNYNFSSNPKSLKALTFSKGTQGIDGCIFTLLYARMSPDAQTPSKPNLSDQTKTNFCHWYNAGRTGHQTLALEFRQPPK